MIAEENKKLAHEHAYFYHTSIHQKVEVAE